MLCIIDEFSRESLAIRVARKLKASDVIEALCELFVSRGVPAHIRSDNGPEFVAEALRDWIAAVGPGPLTSNLEVPGRMAIARASTANFAMNCSTVRSSTR
jgi:transposase InsO family protein